MNDQCNKHISEDLCKMCKEMKLEIGLCQVMFNNIPILLFYKDNKNNFIGLNKYTASFIGKPIEDIIGKSCYDIFPKEQADKYYKDDLEVIENDLPLIDIVEELATDEGTKWVRTDKHPYKNKDGKIVGVVGFSIDITKQKRKEIKLRNLVTAVDQSPNIVVIVNTNREIIYVNPKFTEITGYHYSEVLGKNPNVLNSGKTNKSVYKKLWKILENGKSWKGEFLNKKKDGSLYWELASISPVKDLNGNIINYVKVAEPLNELRTSIFNTWNVLNLVNCFIVVLDADMNIKICNQLLSKILGYNNPQDIYGKSWLDFIPETSNEIIKMVHNSVLDNETDIKEFTNEIIGSDNKVHLVKWFNASINSELNWTFSIGLPYFEEQLITDSADNIREAFVDLLKGHKQLFGNIRKKVGNNEEVDV